MSDLQAEADRPAQEIEVTPAMEKAGAYALEETSGVLSARQIAVAVYTSMVSARPPSTEAL